MVTYSITIIIINDIKEEEEGEDDHRRPVLVHEEEIGAHRSFWRIWILHNQFFTFLVFLLLTCLNYTLDIEALIDNLKSRSLGLC